MKKPLTIVMTGGGSGGHITPLLSLAHALKKARPDCRIVYIGLKGEALEKSLQGRYGIFDEVRHVPSGKFRRYHGESFLTHLIDLRTVSLNLRDFFKVLAGIITARKILKQVKPDVVFSKGGFVVVPVGLAARLQKIPIVTHDSDTVAGLANRIVGHFALVHATGMPANYSNYPKETVRYVGIPLDERIQPVTQALQKKFKAELGFSSDSLILLVGGAGLGSRDVNNLALSIAPKLLESFSGLHIVHFSGQKHLDEVKDKYNNLSPDFHKRVMAIGFTPDFYKFTGAADLVITRAGATTIAELAVQKKPLILIPAAHLTGGHQVMNAEMVEKNGAAVVLDSSVTSSQLEKIVSQILSDVNRRSEMSEKIGLLAKPQASEQLADILIMTAEKGKMGQEDANR